MPKTKRVLVVEDERPIANALVLKLTNSGFEADAANDGAEALEMIGKGSYDVILLDLMMPKMDGFEMLEAMKKKKINIPVIVSTNLSQESDSERAKKLGARDYFVKSDTQIKDVINHIAKVLK